MSADTYVLFSAEDMEGRTITALIEKSNAERASPEDFFIASQTTDHKRVGEVEISGDRDVIMCLDQFYDAAE